jgi:hypothetical protein
MRWFGWRLGCKPVVIDERAWWGTDKMAWVVSIALTGHLDASQTVVER